MKISIVHSYYNSTTPSGENFMVDSQVGALIEAGHDVQLIGVRTDDLEKQSMYKARTALTVATGHGRSPMNNLLRFNPDVVHVHNLFPNFGTHWLQKWAGPIVATMHNFRPMCSNGLLFRAGHGCTLCPEHGAHNAIIHKCYRNSRAATLPIAYSTKGELSRSPLVYRADRIIVLAPRAHETYVRYGVDSNKLSIVPNFIDDTSLDTHKGTDAATWLYAGRLTQEKGIINLLEQWPENEKLEIAGSGPEEESVRTLIKNKKNVKYIGSLQRDDLLTRLGSSKGVVIPSLWAEGIPSVYLEALATARPVISHRGNSAADDLQAWAPSLVYEGKTSLRIALAHVNDFHPQISRDARQRFVEQYTRSTWIRRMTDIYDSVQ